MQNFWQEEITEEQAEALIQKLATKIIERQMQTPAILFLEMHKPLGNLAGHAMVAFAPFTVPFLGFDNVNEFSRLMTQRRHWERLVDVLDQSRQSPNKELIS